MESHDAKAALDAVSRSDRRLVGRTQWPLWRHAAFGAVQAMLLLAWGVPPVMMAALLAVSLAALSWIVHDDRQRYGMFVDGWASPAARPATLACVVLWLAGLVAIVFLGEGPNEWSPIVPVAALAVFVGSTLLSLWWQKLYHADMRRDPARGA